jgi:hypothetical protein
VYTESHPRRVPPLRSAAASISLFTVSPEGSIESLFSLPALRQVRRSYRLSTVDCFPRVSRCQLSPKSFRTHSYEKYARKSFVSHSYKIIGLKVPSNHTLTKKGGGGVKYSSAPFSLRECSIEDSDHFGRDLSAAPDHYLITSLPYFLTSFATRPPLQRVEPLQHYNIQTHRCFRPFAIHHPLLTVPRLFVRGQGYARLGLRKQAPATCGDCPDAASDLSFSSPDCASRTRGLSAETATAWASQPFSGCT